MQQRKISELTQRSTASRGMDPPDTSLYTEYTKIDTNIAADLPQGFSDDLVSGKGSTVPLTQQPRRRRTRRGDTSSEWIFGFILLTILVLVAGYMLAGHHEELQLKHLREEIVHDQLEPLSKEWEEKYATLQEENLSLLQQAKKYGSMKEDLDSLIEEQKKAKSIRKTLDSQISALTKYKERMQTNIKSLSRIHLLEKYVWNTNMRWKYVSFRSDLISIHLSCPIFLFLLRFGPGPHHVEINLEFVPTFPKKQDTDTNAGRIVIELAPIEEMPHVVYWFLEQVSRKLYDGCSFHRNAGHVIQAGPATNFLTPPDSPPLRQRFQHSGFTSILFQEYSPKLPHEKYTLGYAGRPGGPDFYISTRNNTIAHGPGGQSSYEDPTEADPCFARVIEGIDVVDRMQLGPVKPGNYKGYQDNVAITSMRIVSKEVNEVNVGHETDGQVRQAGQDGDGVNQKENVEKIPQDGKVENQDANAGKAADIEQIPKAGSEADVVANEERKVEHAAADKQVSQNENEA